MAIETELRDLDSKIGDMVASLVGLNDAIDDASIELHKHGPFVNAGLLGLIQRQSKLQYLIVDLSTARQTLRKAIKQGESL